MPDAEKIRYLHTLRIMGDSPADLRDLDEEVWAEIERDRDPQDSDGEAVLRWLGGLLSEVEDTLNSLLPLGWYAKIEDGKVGE